MTTATLNSTRAAPLHAPGKPDAPHCGGTEHSLGSIALTPQEPLDLRCKRPKGWLWLRCEHGVILYKPLRCRHCEPCRRHYASIAVGKIWYGVHEKLHISHLGLTSTPGTSWKTIMEAWEQMLRYLRTYSPGLSYAAAKEEGPKTGMRHLHIIIVGLGFVPYIAISDKWKAMTGAWNVWINPIGEEKAMLYATKHAYKAQKIHGKVFTFSRNWPRKPKHVSTLQKAYLPLNQEPLTYDFRLPDGTFIIHFQPECACFDCLNEYLADKERELYHGVSPPGNQ